MRTLTLTTFATKTTFDMKNFGKIGLSFCYLFTLVSVARMCIALVRDLGAVTLANVVPLLVLFIGLGALFFIAGVLLLSDRK
jgi:uncharacterized membrane protein YesL